MRGPPLETRRRSRFSASSLRSGSAGGGSGASVLRAPEGKRLNVLVSFVPSLFADVFTAEPVPITEEQGVEAFPLREWFAGPRTESRTGFDVPLTFHTSLSKGV